MPGIPRKARTRKTSCWPLPMMPKFWAVETAMRSGTNGEYLMAHAWNWVLKDRNMAPLLDCKGTPADLDRCQQGIGCQLLWACSGAETKY